MDDASLLFDLSDFTEEVEYTDTTDLSDKVKDEYKILVDCITEETQERIYNILKSEGLKCQILTS